MFDYVPFSDVTVLSELIRNRMKLDATYKEKVYPNSLLSASSCPEFNENILSVYVSIDMLIDDTPLTKKQRAVIELMMRGWTIQDIADETGNIKSSIKRLFDRAVLKLIEKNNERWRQVNGITVIDEEIIEDGTEDDE